MLHKNMKSCHLITWVYLEYIRPSEIIQSGERRIHDLTLQDLKTKKSQQTKYKLIGTENKLVVARGKMDGDGGQHRGRLRGSKPLVK